MKAIDQKLAAYMKLNRQQLLAIAYAHPAHGEWYREEAYHLTFHDIVKLLLDAEFGRDEGYAAIQRHFKLA